MGRKSRKRKGELLSAETIRGILTGDSVALGELVVNKMNYVKTVIRNYADRNGIELDPDTVDDTSDEKEVVNVPIEKKLNLTIREAAEYSNIGMNKINEMLRNPMCSFVLYVGTKKLVKRKEFEQFLAGRMEI